MGEAQSKAWRSFPQSNQENLKFLKSYQPQNTKAKRLRILLHGPIGAGKSSFINSVDSAFQNRITTAALADATAGTSFTRKYTTYEIRKDSKSFCSFVFNDVMGLEATCDGGIHADDLKLVLKGHVKEGSKFKPGQRLTENDPDYNPSPTLEDRVHVLVSVIPSNKISLLSDSLVNKIRDVRREASDAGIPQLIVISKVDEFSPKTKLDINHAYRSKQLEEEVKKLSETVGIPSNFIFLVKNYHTEMQTNPDMNALILSALRRMVEVGEDFLNRQKDN